MTEIWKDIEGYEGHYQVSSEGRVRSIQRVVSTNNHNRTLSGKMLIPTNHPGGYLFYELCKNGKVVKKFAHRLAATSFVPNPHNKPQVNHINKIKTDNRIQNLEWCTPQENINHKYGRTTAAVKPPKSPKGLIAGCRPVYQYKNGRLVAEYYSLSEASDFVGVSKRCIQLAATGKVLTSAGSTWKFKETAGQDPEYIKLIRANKRNAFLTPQTP